jgi:hypothetical protein
VQRVARHRVARERARCCAHSSTGERGQGGVVHSTAQHSTAQHSRTGTRTLHAGQYKQTRSDAHPLLQASHPSLPARHSLSDTQSSVHTAGSAPVGKPAHSARSTLGASSAPRYCRPLTRTVGMMAMMDSASSPVCAASSSSSMRTGSLPSGPPKSRQSRQARAGASPARAVPATREVNTASEQAGV